ncbi:MAG: hypothetical protein IIA50_03530, partial [Bacteroidetes bacterium]|nr:hypothetical protein [Bacteroidota bacterium]
QVALCRIEQFYPFPDTELRDEMRRFSSSDEVLWVQEEPENMGAWSFLQNRLDKISMEATGNRVRYVGRAASASPATGSAHIHQAEQCALISEALSL